MLESFICSLLLATCMYGAPSFEAVGPVRQTVFERLNAERAARQGTEVVERRSAMPHASTRRPVTLRHALEHLESNKHAPTPVRRLTLGEALENLETHYPRPRFRIRKKPSQHVAPTIAPEPRVKRRIVFADFYTQARAQRQNTAVKARVPRYPHVELDSGRKVH